MKLKLLFLLLTLNGMFFSQVKTKVPKLQDNTVEKCRANHVHERLMNTDPSYVQNRMQIEQQYQQYLAYGVHDKVTYTIPVVVHVVHLGEAVGTGSNISDAQIQSAIDNLNDAYSNQAPYTGVDTEIQFCLAQRDENGDPTTGIVRVLGTGVTQYSTKGICDADGGTGTDNEQAVKALSKWDNTKYYNFWIVSEINDNNAGGGTQGYAYYPGAGASVDGAVVMYNSFGYDPSGSLGYNLKSYTNYNVTTIHEMGHALNIKHTFEGDGTGSTCPTNTTCASDGDAVCDTPPHKRSGACIADGTANSCLGGSTAGDYQHNFMDYTSDDCQTEFTAGQKTRMLAVMTGSRASLTTSDGCNPANNNYDASILSIVAPVSSYCQTTFSPQVTLKNFGLITMTTATITYNIDGGADQTYNWTGSLASGAQAVVTLNSISSTVGAHTFTATSSLPNGQVDAYAPNNSSNVAFTITSSSSLPFTEDFEGSFPPTNWTRTSEDAATFAAWDADGKKQWEQKTATGNGASTKAAAVNCYNYNTNTGSKDILETPSISFSGTISPQATFKVSHKNWSGYDDQLRVLISEDCGVTYTQVYSKAGSTLATNGGSTSAFVPSIAADWRTETLNLSAYAGKTVKLQFEVTNAYGNNIFIDDINIIDNCSTPTIVSSNGAGRCDVGNVTISATPSAGTIKWYTAASGGTLLYTGNSYAISNLGATTDYYAEAVNGTCISAARTLVKATIGGCTQVRALDCGKSLTTIGDQLMIDGVASATNYKFEAYDGTTTLTWTKGSGLLGFKMSSFTNVKYNATYQVRVSAYIAGAWHSFGTYCNITTPKTKVKDNFCNRTITNMTDYLSIYEAKGATNYQYQAFDGTNTLTWTKGSGQVYFKMSNFSGVKANMAYQVRVRAYIGGVWQAFGEYCTITTPRSIPTKCGITLLTTNDQLMIYGENGATNYEYQAFDGTNTLTWIKGSGALGFKMSSFAGVQLNKTYQVRVRAYVGGVWQPYGAYCTIITPVAKISGSDVSEEELIEKNIISVFPNPATSEFTIATSNSCELVILNELGQVMKNVSIQESENNKIVVTGLHRGIYFITGMIDNEIRTEKVVIE